MRRGTTALRAAAIMALATSGGLSYAMPYALSRRPSMKGGLPRRVDTFDARRERDAWNKAVDAKKQAKKGGSR